MSPNQLVDGLKEKYSWITNDLIKTAVENATSKSNVKVKSFLLEPALAAGENFNSQLLRCKVVYNENEELGFLLKIGVLDPRLLDKKGEIDTSSKEYTMFSEIIPKIEKMMATAGEEIAFSAR